MTSKTNTTRTKKSLHLTTSATLRQDATSLGSFSFYTNPGEESTSKLEKKLSRTSMLILDYKQFKAAQKIQAAVRGWLYRRRYRRLKCAAIIIQRDWRRFSAQRRYYDILENKVQEEIVKHHIRSAIRIQAYWRGFFVRENIHDQYRMRTSQRMAAEDLLSCIAYKLHHQLRTYQIPGIYSLRNTHVLSKVEKMLSSISFKQGNQRTFISRLQREAAVEESRKNFKQAAFGTSIPFAGPNYKGVCDPKCSKVYKEPNIDARMHLLLRRYEAESQQKKLKRCVKKNAAPKYKKKDKDTPNFCADIIKSMRRWKMSTPDSLELRPDVFNNPENVQKFLTEIKTIYDNMTETLPCFCKKDMSACEYE